MRDCVLAGYIKIHLDASMACADDVELHEETVADRAAMLCEIAEKTYVSWSGLRQLVYVIGTEVPAPGGKYNKAQAPVITDGEQVHQTLETFHRAFAKRDLLSAWERVIALVVRLGSTSKLTRSLTMTGRRRPRCPPRSQRILRWMKPTPRTTSPASLRQMVEDHFAILKVGPWLTFAYREALLALAAIERELLDGRPGHQRSQVREALEDAMSRNPTYWKSFYHGDERDVRLKLTYGYSDRCRYYWNDPSVQKQVAVLLDNLKILPIPLTLVSQFLPLEYAAIREGRVQSRPEELIRHHIQQVMRVYAAACEG